MVHCESIWHRAEIQLMCTPSLPPAETDVQQRPLHRGMSWAGEGFVLTIQVGATGRGAEASAR